MYLYQTELFENFIKLTQFGIKWPEKGWYAIKQSKQPTNQPTLMK